LLIVLLAGCLQLPKQLYQRKIPVYDCAFLVVPVLHIPSMVSVRNPSDGISSNGAPGTTPGATSGTTSSATRITTPRATSGTDHGAKPVRNTAKQRTSANKR
jgi:hypothetical protein